MNQFVQSTLAMIGPPRGWTAFLMGWTLLGVAVMKKHGYSALWLHDEIIFQITANKLATNRG